MHHLARLARFDDERHLRTRLLADQVIVHGRHRQQAGNGSGVRVDAAVGENQQGVAGLYGQRGAAAEARQRPFQASGAIFHREEHGQRGGQKIAL